MMYFIFLDTCFKNLLIPLSSELLEVKTIQLDFYFKIRYLWKQNNSCKSSVLRALKCSDLKYG